MAKLKLINMEDVPVQTVTGCGIRTSLRKNHDN